MSAEPTDYLGTRFEPDPAPRILSLVPSLTELLFDMGLGERLVGRTHYCIHPRPAVDAVPSVGGTKKIKMARVRDLAPTHALLNVDENPKGMADDLAAMGVKPVVTHPMRPDDNVALFELIGGLFARDKEAAALVDDFRTARHRLNGLGERPERRALYLIWKDPWMAIGADTYIANTLGLVNWRAVTPGADTSLAGDAARYPTVALDDETLDDVDLVLFSTEPYAFTRADLLAFDAAHPAHAGKAHLIDGEMTSWYGSRAIRGLDYLAEFARRIGG